MRACGIIVNYVLEMTGLPAIVVGLIAAIKPETYDMSKTYYKDITCGSLKLHAEIMRDRLVEVSVKSMHDSPLLSTLIHSFFHYGVL